LEIIRLKNKIDLTNLPKHIAFIMDGNGRWARKRALPRNLGHKAGAESLERLLEEAAKLGISHVTVYAFSTENRDRPTSEVEYLMGLMENYIDNNIARVKENNYRIRIIGNVDMLDARLLKKIRELELLTKDKIGLCFNIALFYGGRDELVRAVKKVIESGTVAKDVTEALINQHLDTAQMPEPDLIIRTSGEKRLSNFLIWQSAYSEIYFCDKFWPDFGIDDLVEAIADYQGRDRRFGKV